MLLPDVTDPSRPAEVVKVFLHFRAHLDGLRGPPRAPSRTPSATCHCPSATWTAVGPPNWSPSVTWSDLGAILAHLGLIDRRRDGLSRRLTTTRRFAEMFGCPYAESKKVRTWFREHAAKMGMDGAELAASLGDGQEEIQDAPEVPVGEDWDESSAELIHDEEE